MSDTDIIRSVRVLCLEYRFDEATQLAEKVVDEQCRKALLEICKSFANTQYKVRAA